MGASTHIIWTIENGLLSKRYGAPFFSMLFWDSLTFLDPLAAFFLIAKPRIGIFLTLIIIIFDVIHNNIFYAQELYFSSISISDWLKNYWMIAGQIIFGIFVEATFRSNYHNINKAQRHEIKP